MHKVTRAFTLVELVIVIVIIGILASITLVSYSKVQAKGRDTDRKNDLAAIAEAIQLYRQKYGNDVVTSPSGTSCGSSGNGWFNYATGNPGAYQYSMLSCLTGAGYLDGGGKFVDPSGCTTTSSSLGSTGPCKGYGGWNEAYMKYSYGSGDTSVTCLYAHLETEDNSSTMTSTSPCSITPTLSNPTGNYRMNYMVVVK